MRMQRKGKMGFAGVCLYHRFLLVYDTGSQEKEIHTLFPGSRQTGRWLDKEADYVCAVGRDGMSCGLSMYTSLFI